MISGSGPPITLLKPGCLIARMGEKQSDLDKQIPIDYIMDWIGNQLRDSLQSKTRKVSMSDRVVVLLSKTGSGKSSSIAPNLYLRFFNKYKKHILITQPRVLTAIDIPRDIAMISSYRKPNKEGLSIELFRNLGYQTQEFVKKPKERGILFSTTGILLQFLKTMSDETFIKRYKFIIIDEAHDRSLDVDLVLFMMKALIKRNLTKDPPFLILMSATLNVDEYSSYFETKTVFEVSGQSKPIEVRYPEFDIQNINMEVKRIIHDINEREIDEVKTVPEIKHMYENGIRDVIIFMPNTAYINRMVKACNEFNRDLLSDKSIKNPKLILPLSITSMDINHSTANYKMLMAPAPQIAFDDSSEFKDYKPYRRVIVSTNVAETGLTLESLRYCIDTALMFTNEFNPRFDVSIFAVKPVTSSMSLQRKGRVGRKFPGVFYPLYTESTFGKMIVDNTPSILIDDITSHILTMLASNSEVPVDKLPISQLLTPPSDESMAHVRESMFILGAIDSNGYITKLGSMMSLFRKLPIQSCKMILSSVVYGVSVREIVTLACLLEMKRSDLFILEIGEKPLSAGDIINELYENDNKCDYNGYNQFKMKLLIGCEFLESLLIYQRFISMYKSLNNLNELRMWCNKKIIIQRIDVIVR